MVANVSWNGDTLVEGVEHVEGSRVYVELYGKPHVGLAYSAVFVRLRHLNVTRPI